MAKAEAPAETGREDTTVVWAATSAWRGDVKLFAQIAERAIAELEALGEADVDCLIEFAVRDDVERYKAAQDLFDVIPASTLKLFSSARIHVTGTSIRVEVCFGRKRAAKNADFVDPLGITVQVSSRRPDRTDELDSVRSAVVCSLKRGAFFWAADPVEGPSENRADLMAALNRRRKKRQALVQLLLIGMALLVVVLAFVALTVFDTASGSTDSLPVEEMLALAVVVAIAVLVQGIATPLANFIFPAIEIADVTPGRRIFRVVGRSGIITTGVGALGTVLFEGSPI